MGLLPERNTWLPLHQSFVVGIIRLLEVEWSPEVTEIGYDIAVIMHKFIVHDNSPVGLPS